MKPTLYDVLEVSHHASQGTIKAAYKSLIQRYHPDKNDGASNLENITTNLNRAYQILSDPETRKRYDDYLKAQGRWSDAPVMANEKPQRSPVNKSTEFTTYRNESTYQQPKQNDLVKRRKNSNRAAIVVIVIVIIFGVLSFSKRKDDTTAHTLDTSQTYPAQAGGSSLTQSSINEPPPYVHVETGYTQNNPMSNNDGHSQLTVDNSGNSTDALVKIYNAMNTPVRIFNLRAGQSFTAENMTPGSYEVRYKVLPNGHPFKSEPLLLQETSYPGGIQYSSMTVTLYTVPHGNMHTYQIPDSEF